MVIFKTEIVPFKNRGIDYNSPVYIYRNLQKKGVWYSIKQNNLVVGHTQNLVLRGHFEKGITFKIGKSGQDRARRTKQRNVHAYIVGFILDKIDFCLLEGVRITYNPFFNDTFVLKESYREINKKYYYCVMSKRGVFLL